jgi:hypothetical protein
MSKKYVTVLGTMLLVVIMLFSIFPILNLDNAFAIDKNTTTAATDLNPIIKNNLKPSILDNSITDKNTTTAATDLNSKQKI